MAMLARMQVPETRVYCHTGAFWVATIAATIATFPRDKLFAVLRAICLGVVLAYIATDCVKVGIAFGVLACSAAFP